MTEKISYTICEPPTPVAPFWTPQLIAALVSNFAGCVVFLMITLGLLHHGAVWVGVMLIWGPGLITAPFNLWRWWRGK